MVATLPMVSASTWRNTPRMLAPPPPPPPLSPLSRTHGCCPGRGECGTPHPPPEHGLPPPPWECAPWKNASPMRLMSRPAQATGNRRPSSISGGARSLHSASPVTEMATRKSWQCSRRVCQCLRVAQGRPVRQPTRRSKADTTRAWAQHGRERGRRVYAAHTNRPLVRAHSASYRP